MAIDLRASADLIGFLLALPPGHGAELVFIALGIVSALVAGGVVVAIAQRLAAVALARSGAGVPVPSSRMRRVVDTGGMLRPVPFRAVEHVAQPRAPGGHAAVG